MLHIIVMLVSFQAASCMRSRNFWNFSRRISFSKQFCHFVIDILILSFLELSLIVFFLLMFMHGNSNMQPTHIDEFSSKQPNFVMFFYSFFTKYMFYQKQISKTLNFQIFCNNLLKIFKFGTSDKNWEHPVNSCYKVIYHCTKNEVFH